MHTPARGASHWPFIITLLLFLVAIFLWFDQKGELETANKKAAELQKQLDGDPATNAPGLKSNMQAMEDWADKVTAAVGWKSLQLPGAPLHAMKVTDPDLVAAAFNLDKPDSPLAKIKAASTVTYIEAKYKPGKGSAAGQVAIAGVTQAFRDKMKEVIANYPKEGPPSPCVDPDDAPCAADYAARKAAYDAQFAKYSALLDGVVKDPQFKDLPVTIDGGPIWDLDKVAPLAWSFWDKPATAFPTLEEFMAIPASILINMRDSYIERVAADKKELDAMAELSKQKDKTIDNPDEANPGLTQKIAKEQEGRAADVARLSKEADVARAETEKLRVSQTSAEQGLATEKEAHKKEVDKLAQTVKAQNDRIVNDKEVQDLQIKRDEPDGLVTGADAALGVAWINLGNQDKIYAGLKFEVSSMPRGNLRITKGEIVVTEVIDAHYSKARILSQVFGERPIAADDLISNPFFNRNRPTHLYLAGDLRKYPRAIATARLEKMGVIVEDKIWEKTDWVLIPDSMSAKPAADAAAPADAGAAKAESDLDKLTKLAHTFGATLITERMIEHFLDY